ncbi:hypothetical protein BO83DRAFT_404404 [Aspergillus eucalypticola CBS 122712]|uniref:Uncharacterized protein n=5 Tax=Aspergillus TaxID=5052 RepID=A0A317UK98_ASPEC|nr:uncharacterized protein BO83DRAFT_413011 [Aspergillus eucalypticola CBS 122712]PWY61496.1 hypothetical protein BO83DRAFT_413011 [Aspergillus eucalypticola CBS 122712]PWY61618.1 hypothetical protein BO83DRAFT_404404 [Aspergillus eucalypticola CBS 122712]
MTRHLATLRDQIPLVRTSSKLVVKRPPDGRSLPRASPTRCWGAPAGCPASAPLLRGVSPKAQRARPLEPILIPKGCSPWRPAAVMSTTWRENYSFPRIFKDRRGRTGPCKGAGLCRPWNPSSGQTDFRVIGRQEEKRTLPRTPADVSAFSYVADRLTHVQLLFTWNLSPLQSSKFSFEYLLLPPRSALGAVRPGITPKASSRTPTPAYSSGHRFYPDGEVWVARLSAIHFQG